jgi:hypothetical protein
MGGRSIGGCALKRNVMQGVELFAVVFVYWITCNYSVA